jgi:hypothetical protein
VIQEVRFDLSDKTESLLAADDDDPDLPQKPDR